jgi:hypothetical protein
LALKANTLLRHENPFAFDIGKNSDFIAAIHITGTFAGARFATYTQFKYFIQFFVVELIVFSECVRYSRNALALARVVCLFISGTITGTQSTTSRR